MSPLRWFWVHVGAPGLDDLRNWWRELREQREWIRRDVRERERRERYVCPHQDYLCDKYGCPDDPRWTGDRR